MFLKIVCLIIGVILLGIGAPMAEGSVSDPYNIYKRIVGAELAFAGLIIALVSLIAIFPGLLPF